MDIRTTLRILRDLGVDVEEDGDSVRLHAPDDGPFTAPYDLVRRMRASVCCLGPLLARRGRARVSQPGGCAIGDRPIDLHTKGLMALGAEIRIRHGYLEASTKGLKGTTVFLSGAFGSTVLGTAHIMLAASRAKGVTIIEGAACEPEIISLGEFLKVLGVPMQGVGSHCIEIEGVDRLGGGEFRIPPDRIEAGTYMIAGALAGGEVVVEGCDPCNMRALLDILQRMEVPLEAERT